MQMSLMEEVHHQMRCVESDQILASFPDPALLFIACSMEKQVCTASDEKLAEVWVNNSLVTDSDSNFMCRDRHSHSCLIPVLIYVIP